MVIQHPRQTQAGRIDLWVAALTLTLLGIVLLVAYVRIDKSTTQYIAPAGSPMKLWAVRPDGTDDLLDPQGRHIGKLLYDNSNDNTWATNSVFREFIFELTDTNLGKISAQLNYRRKGVNTHLSGTTALSIQKLPDGRRRLLAKFKIPSHYYQYRLFFPRRRLLMKQVDLELNYFAEFAREQSANYRGPFKAGQVLTKTKSVSGTIQRKNQGSFVITEIILTSPSSENISSTAQVMVYDNDGQQQRPQSSSSSSGNGINTVTLRFNTLMPEDIDRIVIPKAQKAVYKNVQIYYPDQPYRSTPAYWEPLTAALGDTNKISQLHSNPFDSLEQALSMIHLLRGDLIYRVWRMYENPRAIPKQRIDLQQASPDLQQAVRQAAQSWLVSYNKKVRLASVGFGLSGGWNEFLDPALELMELDEDLIRSQVARMMAKKLDALSSEQFQRLARLILGSTKPLSFQPIIEKLAAMDNPEAQAIVWQLAKDKRPWIWHSVLLLLKPDYVAEDHPDRALIKQRFFLVNDNKNNLTEIEIAQAYATLPEILTLSLWRQDPRVFMSFYRKLAAQSDKTMATNVLLRLIQSDANPARHGGIYYGMIRQLNQWQGRDFGKLGNDPKATMEERKSNAEWMEIFAEILESQ